MQNNSYVKKLFEVYRKSPTVKKFSSSGIYLKEDDPINGDDPENNNQQQPEDQQQQQPEDQQPEEQQPEELYPKKDKIDVDKDLRLANRRDFRAGVTIMYGYYPKHHMTLPFYDMLPIQMIFRIAGDRMWGFNFHYIPSPFRERIVDTMIRQKRGAGGFSYYRMKHYFQHIPYGILKYCVKEYLYSHIVSRIKFVPERYVQQILLEQPPQFKKQSASQIYSFIIRNISQNH